ncbi:MAG TPA: tetratricopeptide repeat protein [Verrucomicrobiae bacterium]|nr:tetratricopeptide repeat protein [Verrucomicrobiae bacterium]
MRNATKSQNLGVLLFLLTVVAYLPSLRAGFVFDDDTLIRDNRMIKAGEGLYQFWFTSEAPDYYPLTWSVWWLEWRAWGNHAAWYHLVNLVLHAMNAVLVWQILRRLNVPAAWLIGLVFAVHPVNVATTAWISEQKNTLSMMFYALAILAFLKFDEENHWPWYGLSLGAFLLALLSKSAVVMLPVVLLGCIWWRRGRVGSKEILRSIPFFVLSLISGLATIWFQHNRALEGQTVRPDGFAARLAGAGWVPWFYLEKTLLPLNLTVIYRKWDIDPSQWVSYVPGIALLACFAVFWWKRKTWGRAMLFGLGYFVVTLFPVLGFFDQGFYRNSLVADHWQYYSIVGVIALAVVAGELACRRLGKTGQIWRGIAIPVLVIGLGIGTWKRCGVYSNNLTLWQDNVRKNPAAWLAQNNLGVALAKEGARKQAVECYEEALRLNPIYAEAQSNLGTLLQEMGRMSDAILHHEQAVRLDPNLAVARFNFGNALLQLGNVAGAVEQYQRAIQIDSDYAIAHINLGNAFVRLGKRTEAIEQYEKAIQADPDYAEAHCNLGNLLLQAGNPSAAIQHYARALQLKPDYAAAHYNWGVALAEQGRLQEAAEHWEEAVRLKPDYAEAHCNLGVALEKAGKIQEAISEYEQAVRFHPGYAKAESNLVRLRAAQ